MLTSSAEGRRQSYPQVPLFAEVLVTLTKEQEIKLRCEANFWRSQTRQALVRLAESEAAHRVEMAQVAAREVALRSELEPAQGQIRDPQKRLFGRNSERSSGAEKSPAADQKYGFQIKCHLQFPTSTCVSSRDQEI